MIILFHKIILAGRKSFLKFYFNFHYYFLSHGQEEVKMTLEGNLTSTPNLEPDAGSLSQAKFSLKSMQVLSRPDVQVSRITWMQEKSL